jgi:uncharacterized protein
MKCPTCQIELKMADRQGVEIDYCPQCRGVWLDRGELDKIIERAGSEGFSSTSFQGRKTSYEREHSFARRWDDDDYEHGLPRNRRRKSFLGELFDFD